MFKKKTIKFLVIILFICISGDSFAQKTSKYPPPPPPSPKIKVLTYEEVLYPNIVERIIETNETRVSFRWDINKFKDTLVLPNVIFSEIIEFNNGADSRTQFVKDSIHLKIAQIDVIVTMITELKSFKI